MPLSDKPAVIQRIYEMLVDPATGALSRRIVTHDDVQQAINWCNENKGTKLSTKNTANFIKDVVRGKGSEGMWPESLKAKRIGCRPLPGGGRVFEFVDYAPGQTLAFPERFKFDPNDASLGRHRLQTLSMPHASKLLGRTDETWLIQVAAKLGLVETHFALCSNLELVEVTHLQSGIKLRETEVDALYSGLYNDGSTQHRALIITLEAKHRGQRILEDQIIRQVRAAFDVTKVDIVVPTTMVVVQLGYKQSGIYFVEFSAVRRADSVNLEELEVATRMVYELIPPVPGI